jgi:predicted lipid-binding transport protein (Tim44 family)
MIEELVKYDNNFNEGMFKSYIDNIFVKIYTAIMLDELDTVKHFISNDLYDKLKNKIDNLNSKNLTQMYDELNVKSSTITNIEILDNEFVITVNLVSRYMDYLIDKNTGNFVSGNNTSRIEKNNILNFKKKKNYIVQDNLRRCSYCGAALDVNNNGKCAYCGKNYNLDDYEYILYDIKEV